jgi:hypothetical protein
MSFDLILNIQRHLIVLVRISLFLIKHLFRSNLIIISLLYSPTAGIDYSYDDYRLFSAPQFQLLSSLCTLANETLTEAIAQFSTNIITNERVQSSESIETQAESILSQFRYQLLEPLFELLILFDIWLKGTVLSLLYFLIGILFRCIHASSMMLFGPNRILMLMIVVLVVQMRCVARKHHLMDRLFSVSVLDVIHSKLFFNRHSNVSIMFHVSISSNLCTTTRI